MKYFLEKVATKLSQLIGNTESPGATAVKVIEKDSAGMVLRATGTTKPTDGEAGYAKGCLFLKTDVGAGTTGIYENVGTITACNFDVIGSGGTGATVFTDLGDVPGTYAGQGNKIVKVNNAGTALEFVTISGDVAMSQTGVTTVTDLTISGEQTNDMLYRNATNWVRLAAGTDGYVLRSAAGVPTWVDPTGLPSGTASIIAQSATIEAGAFDVTLSTTTQTAGVTVLTIPDFAGVNDTFAFVTKAATFVNKTLTDTTCIFGANGALTKTMGFDLSALTAGNKITIAFAAGTAQTVTIPNATDTLVGKATTDTLTNKTLSDSTTVIGAVGALTKAVKFSLAGATADKTTTLTFVHTDDRAITFPDATDTLVGKATADVFTNKTFDCDAAGNVLTNVNANELDPVAMTTGQFAVPFVIVVENAGNADINVFAGNVPFKVKVLDMFARSTKAGNSGTFKITDGTDDISTAVGYSVTDDGIVRVGVVDNSKDSVTGKPLHLVSTVAGDTATVYITCIREA